MKKLISAIIIGLLSASSIYGADKSFKQNFDTDKSFKSYFAKRKDKTEKNRAFSDIPLSLNKQNFSLEFDITFSHIGQGTSMMAVGILRGVTMYFHFAPKGKKTVSLHSSYGYLKRNTIPSLQAGIPYHVKINYNHSKSTVSYTITSTKNKKVILDSGTLVCPAIFHKYNIVMYKVKYVEGGPKSMIKWDEKKKALDFAAYSSREMDAVKGYIDNVKVTLEK
jgi:hypothetical protein